MDGAMGNEEEVVEAVVTCEGDFHDPELLNYLEKFRLKLRDILLLEDESKLNLKKVEPWNSVKVTFTIPREAALRLRQLAQSGSETLRQMGILSVQLQGDSSISLKIVGRNNETTELMLHTPKVAAPVGLSPLEHGATSANEVGSSPGPSNEEVTRKNIVDYLIQGPPHLRPNAIFNSILGVHAPAAAPFLGPNRGTPPSSDPFLGLENSRPLLRPNSIPNMPPLPNPSLRSSHSNSFTLAKTSGAFHVPIPHQSSAGQSSNNFSNSQVNAYTINKSAPGHMNPSGFHSGSQQNNQSGTMNTFGPIGSRMPSSSNISSTLPPSSSGFMIDLPPPPPYPHSSCNSTAKPGKPVSASSPLLVNLLQTDPMAVAAGMASANTTTTGSTSTAPPVKKKKRSKKVKESIPNSFSNMDDTPYNKDIMGVNPNLFNPAYSSNVSGIPISSDPFLSPKLQMEFSPESAETEHGFSHVHKSDSKLVSDKSVKPLLSSDRPFSENSTKSSAFTLTKLNTSVSSAIVTDHVRSSEANGQGELSKELIDSFSREIAAGKIINPYTGQLESRDSILESSGGKLKEETISSRVVSNMARDIGGSNLSDVPVSVSRIMDINVLRSFSTVSSSTAAFFHSGSSPHLSSDKLLSPNPPHRRNPNENSVSTNKNIYAAKLNSMPERESCQTSMSISTQSIFSTQHQISASSIQHQVKCTNTAPTVASNSTPSKIQQGRSVFNQIVQGSLPPHAVPTSSLSSGVSESVINSSLGSSCSPSTLPVHQDSIVRRLEHSPTLFQPTSCANSNTQSSFPHHTFSPKMFSSTSQSVVQNRPVPSQAPTSLQASERLKSTEVIKPISSQHVQAAGSDSITSVTKTNFPHLLNSHPEKSLDQQGMVPSPLEKVSPEGDDNSNHSGLVSENIPEASGTSVLLEHAHVKAENHDSGVGSSSERSDDTPSEPGDGEFRATTNCSESDEVNKATKRLVNHKGDGAETTPGNTITVGYMMSSIDTVSQPKSSQPRDSGHEIKTTISLTTSSSSKIAKFLDSHVHSLDKNTDSSVHHSLSSSDWTGNQSQADSSIYSGKVMNGPIHDEKEEVFKVAKKELKHDLKTNGPTSKEMEEILMTMADLQKNDQHASKHNIFKRHDLQIQHEVFEEMAKLASKDLSTTPGKLEKDDASESIPRSLVGNEERQDQFQYFDMEDLVNGKIFGNGTSNTDKTGSNITSIYSKRSSPVNVNMLNHIYAPGLPLPRRLTESVQRLVKPLPASESSMPQMRLCKSPGAGSPRAGSGINGPSPSRMALHSGTRSPGASIPKLMHTDKHSLLSGGLDLAGLSKFPLNSLPHSDFASENMSNDSSSRLLGLTTDFLSKDGQSAGFLSSCHVSPPLLTDSLAHSQKMLSQSYPPHKSRDSANNAALHDLFSRILPNSSLTDSVPVPMQDQNTRQSQSSCESSVSSNSLAWTAGHRQNIPRARAQTDCISVSSLGTSVSSHILAPEVSTKNQAPTSLSKSYKSQEIPSISSPNHSNSPSPTTNLITDRTESSSLSNITSSFQSVLESGVAAPWTKISLNNGSNISQMKQKIAISTQKNVPYVTLSSSSVATSLSLSAKPVASRMTPSVSSALSPGSVGDSVNSLVENSALLKSPKSDTRARNKPDLSMPRSSPAASVLSRNLFESVSCDFTGFSQHSSLVQSSRNKTVDTLVSHSSSKSVLDLNHAQDLNFQASKVQRKNVDCALGSISPELNYNTNMVMNSLQSIRTNETPSTSLPAQVVHLDFPHLPPIVSETSIGKSMVEHIVPVAPKIVNSPVQTSKVVNHNWGSSPTNTSLGTGFPVKTSVSKTDTVAFTVSTLSDKSDFKNTKDSERILSPSKTKEPILETLASALGSSLKAKSEGQSHEYDGTLSSSVASSLMTETQESIEKDLIEKTSVHSPTNTNKIEVPVFSHEHGINQEPTVKRTRKRSVHNLLEDEQKDDTDGFTDHSAAKQMKFESTNALVSLSKASGDMVLQPETNIGDNNLRTNRTSTGDSSQVLTQKFCEQLPESVLSDMEEKNSNSEGSLSTMSSQSSVSVSEESVVTQGEKAERCSIPLTSDNIDEHLPLKSDEQTSPLTEHELPRSEPSGVESETLKSSESVQDKEKVEGEILANEKSEQDLEINLNDRGSSENNGCEPSQNVQNQSKSKKDVGESILDQDPFSATANAKNELEDGAKKGHRTKRQFYAYVPEKSIDQTYFDTPILSGRTRSRNKPSDATNQDSNVANQEGCNVTRGLSDSNTSLVTSLKPESSDSVASKRSTRSLRTKDNSQDLNASKRRRLQARDHR